MTYSVKEFLQRNKDKINNLYELFDDAYDQLINPHFVELVNVLKDAKVEDVEEIRERVLNKICTEMITDFGTLRNPSIVAMPVIDFIAAGFNNFLGFTTRYISEYIFKHADQWSDVVKLHIDENGIPLIERINV